MSETTEQEQEPTQVEPEDQATTEAEPEPEEESTEEESTEDGDDGDDEAAEEEGETSEFHPNKKQQEVKEVFDLMREEGVETPNATKYAVTALPRPSKKFVEWLSDGSMTVTKGKVVEREVA